MASNQPENAAARIRAEKHRRRVESRFSSGPGAAAANSLGAAPFAFAPRPTADRRPRREGEFETVVIRRSAPEGAERPRGADVGDAVGRELRNLFDDVVAQPVPDRFLTLLDRLEKDMVSSEAPPTAPGESE